MSTVLLPAHGLGGSTDLPIPFLYATVGAAWALTISFAVLALAWKEPKFADLPVVERRPRRTWLAVVGAVLTAWVLGVLFLGTNDTGNGGQQAVYVFVWVGLVPLALLFGHVWRDLSPWRSIQGLVGRATGRPDGWLTYPARLGYWPAAIGLFAFAWLELASPDPGSVTAMCWWMAIYVAVTVSGGILFGPTWFDRADPFDVYSAVVARLSPFVGADGRWDPHNPLRTLPTLPVAPGIVAVLGVLLGTTAYDSFSASPFWQQKSTSVLTDTTVLLGFAAFVAVLFFAASVATGGVDPAQRRRLPGLNAHSLVPIVVGYVFAHYLTYLLEKGQAAFIALAGLDGKVSYFLSNQPELLAGLKVAFVVAGHVLAVIAAHDAALRELPKAHRLTGQLAMLVLMVIFTFSGLYLLLSV